VSEQRARPTMQVDNERVRVTEWRFAPGAATGYHRHEYDYVVVPLTSGKLLLKAPDGDHEAELVAGRSYFRRAGVEHDVINANAHDFAFVEIEIKATGREAGDQALGIA
jgi:beta-alanine degradation protein BauB